MFDFLNKQIAAATETSKDARMGDDMDADREMAAMQAAADKVGDEGVVDESAAAAAGETAQDADADLEIEEMQRKVIFNFTKFNVLFL